MTTSFQPRQPRGIPVGGQWAAQQHGEATVDLSWADSDDPWGDPAPTPEAAEPEAPSPAPAPSGSPCPRCDGRGSWTMARPRAGENPERPCAVCSGTGTLPETAVLPVGSDTGLRIPASNLGGYVTDEPVALLVTEHNRDLVGLLTQDDIDNDSELLSDLGRVEYDRLRNAITPADVTLPADPTPEDIARVASAIDAAFADTHSTLGRGYIPGPHPVLAETYGTPDRALVALGAAVADRADLHASGLAEGGAQATEQRWIDRRLAAEAAHKARWVADMADRFPELSESDYEALYCKSADVIEIESARDPHTRQALADMTSAYTAALAEVRPVGGVFALHEESSKPGATVVAATGAIWPTDWVEDSNNCPLPLHIGTSIDRAHYKHETNEKFKRRGQGTAVIRDVDPDAREITYGPGDKRIQRVDLDRLGPDGTPMPRETWVDGDRVSTYTSYEPLSDAEKQALGFDPTDRSFRALEWEYRDVTKTETEYHDYLGRVLRSRGFERDDYEHLSTDVRLEMAKRNGIKVDKHPLAGGEVVTIEGVNKGQPIYRKPKVRANTIGEQAVSQIKLSKDRVSGPADRDPRYAPAVHEVAHRMEYLVPNLNRMTMAWRNRRVAESPTEEGRTLRPIYRGTREVGMSDEFSSAYVGRVYAERTDHPFYRRPKGAAEHFAEATEVFSMGSDALFGGRRGGLIGLSREHGPDNDMRNFVLGVFAAAGMSRQRQ